MENEIKYSKNIEKYLAFTFIADHYFDWMRNHFPPKYRRQSHRHHCSHYPISSCWIRWKETVEHKEV